MAQSTTIDADTGQVVDSQVELEKPFIPARIVNLGVCLFLGFALGYAYCWDKNRKSKSRD